MSKWRNLVKPVTEEICTTGPCYEWIHTEQWTSVRFFCHFFMQIYYNNYNFFFHKQCSAQCNGGFEENIPQCISITNGTQQVVNDKLCNDVIRPQTRRVCNTDPCLPSSFNIKRRRGRGRRWDVGPWSSVNIFYKKQFHRLTCFLVHFSVMYHVVSVNKIAKFDVWVSLMIEYLIIVIVDICRNQIVFNNAFKLHAHLCGQRVHGHRYVNNYIKTRASLWKNIDFIFSVHRFVVQALNTEVYHVMK